MFPEIRGFRLKVNEKTYVPDNLWDLIDGAADSYLEYDFEELFLAEYTSNPNVSVRVEIYQHKDVDNAFGIYATERMPDYNFLRIGVEAYSSQGILNFFSGKYYIKLQGNDGMALELVGEELVAHLKQDDSFPREISYFPGAYKPYTSGYANHNFLGHSFLNGFFYATYSYEEDFKTFIAIKDDPEKAKTALKSFLDVTNTRYKKITNGIYKLNDPYSGTVYICLDKNRLFGTVNCNKKKVAYYMIDSIRKNFEE